MKSVLRTEKSPGLGLWRKIIHCAAIFVIATGTMPSMTRPAQALLGSTKTLTILHMHTGESATVTFKRNGVYDQQALQKLNWILRDWRTDEPTKMDPRLFDLLAEVYEESGSRQPIRVLSAYRSPRTNSMLRRRSKKVAEHSQHMLGKAMDFYLTDVSPDKLRAIGMKLQAGGVGFYPNNPTHFTHLDVGGVRAWPRMTRAQLASLFPDGKTVHIPADGRPLSGYEEAKAMILARGGKVAGEQYAVADASSGGSGKSFWSRLFGGSDEEEDQEIAAPTRTMTASRRAPAQQVAANDDSDRPVNFFTRTPPRALGSDVPATPTPAEPAPVRVAAVDSNPVQPPAPRLMDSQFTPVPAPTVPLPPARQVATLTNTSNGPQMVWQAGPPGQAPDSPFRAASGAVKSNGPQMVWQAGPPGQVTDSPFKAASGAAKVPFTSAAQRPGAESIDIAMAYAPLPPSRPATAAIASRRGADLADAPITTASLPHTPLPPSRPTQAAVKRAALAPAPAKLPAKPQTSQNFAAKPAPKAKPATKTSGGNRAAQADRGFVRSAYVDLSPSEFTGAAFKGTSRKK